MQEFLVALFFISLVASPAIIAALPMRDEEVTPKGLADAVNLPLPYPSNGR